MAEGVCTSVEAAADEALATVQPHELSDRIGVSLSAPHALPIGFWHHGVMTLRQTERPAAAANDTSGEQQPWTAKHHDASPQVLPPSCQPQVDLYAASTKAKARSMQVRA